jgi:hypothetical protein
MLSELLKFAMTMENPLAQLEFLFRALLVHFFHLHRWMSNDPWPYLSVERKEACVAKITCAQ